MPLRSRLGAMLLLVAAGLFLPPRPAAAAEVMCDPAFQDCKTLLLTRIQNETYAIDVAMLFMEDDDMANALIARHNAGVRVRALVEPRRNKTTPKNAIILDRLAAAGIPILAKNGAGILHWKFMIFDAQNVVQFSAANYSDFYFRPTVPYANYTDEGIYFCDDAPLVDSFRRKFDDAWIDPNAFYDYANISSTRSRRYGLYPIDPSLSFVPFEDFATRSVPFYDREEQRIDTIMYKITEPRHADGLIRAANRGVPVRLIVEGDRYRHTGNVWQAYQVDRLYMAGVQIRDRAHEGFLHQKSTLLYGQGTTIFGSSNWSIESNKSQYEHNYFTTKSWFFTWFRDNFERKWTNRTGNIETKPFVPLPPGAPVYGGPANGAIDVSTSGVVLTWNPGPWGHLADVYFGTSSTPPLVAANVTVSPSGTARYTLPTLASGTTYYWRIGNKTMAHRVTLGPVNSFTTAGGTTPPPNLAPAVTISSPAPNSTFIAPAAMTVAASASDSDGRVARVDFYAGSSSIGSATSDPFQIHWGNVPAGTYTLTARATDDDGAATTSSPVTITVTAPAPAPSLPSPWESQDIGSVGVAGTASASNGTFTVRGAGADVWGTADAFHYAWQRISGDVDVVARIASVEYVHAWVKAGVMIRERLTAGSPHAFMLASPGKGLAFQRRLVGGGLSTSSSGGLGTAPVWVKLERRGNAIAAFHSRDNSTWTLVARETIAMAADVHVGLAVSSHDTTRTAAGVFDNVTVRPVTSTPPPPTLPTPWQAQDIGAVGAAGTATASAGTFTVRGAGADVWGSADALHFAWQRLTGDFDVVSRVASVEYVHAWTKAGVMIRERLTADSAQAFMLVSPAKGIAFQRRVATGGLSTSTSGGSGTAPAWVRLARRGSIVTASRSLDGVTWTTVGSDTFSMGSEVYAGLAVSSHDPSRLASATFDNVAITAAGAPAPAGGSEIVLHAAQATARSGAWQLVADSTAAGGQRAWNPNIGNPKVVTALASPSNYIEFTFNAEAGRPYRLWIRGKADGDLWSNDSVHVQFSGSVDAGRAAVYRIGTTTSTEYNLESCRGCGLSGWGWEDNGWGAGVAGEPIYFAVTGTQRIRIQTREDGLSFDQVVLSSGTYLNAAPGPTKNDTTILQRQ